jgi:hypothetical protein
MDKLNNFNLVKLGSVYILVVSIGIYYYLAHLMRREWNFKNLQHLRMASNGVGGFSWAIFTVFSFAMMAGSSIFNVCFYLMISRSVDDLIFCFHDGET